MFQIDLPVRLSFEGDDGCSEDSGFDPPPVMSPHSSSQMSSPEPVDLQEILTGIFSLWLMFHTTLNKSLEVKKRSP